LQTRLIMRPLRNTEQVLTDATVEEILAVEPRKSRCRETSRRALEWALIRGFHQPGVTGHQHRAFAERAST
jgi:hypothetical protein